MEDILSILEIFRYDLIVNDKIDKLGTVNEIIGKIHFVKPINKNIDGMSFVILNDKISTLGIVLKNGIDFKSITNRLKNDYSSQYNHYDEETFLNFKVDNCVLLSCFLDGYIEKENLLNTQFFRFNFRLLQSLPPLCEE